MGIDDAVKAVELLKPKKVVPMHFNTFDLIAVDPVSFITKVAGLGVHAQILDVGETIEI